MAFNGPHPTSSSTPPEKPSSSSPGSHSPDTVEGGDGGEGTQSSPLSHS